MLKHLTQNIIKMLLRDIFSKVITLKLISLSLSATNVKNVGPLKMAEAKKNDFSVQSIRISNIFRLLKKKIKHGR